MPELVTEDARGFKAVRYHLLPLMLIQALKEQQAIIERQQRDIEELKGALRSLAGAGGHGSGAGATAAEHAEVWPGLRPRSQ